MATVEVIIKTIDQGSKQATQSLGGSLTSLAGKYLAVGTVATAVYKTVKDSIDTTMKYAREVRNLAQVSGTGAEQASRLLQVLDDYELTAQDVTAATRFMTKQGLTPTIETLAKLSDEYLKINGAQEKNEFILKNLGRGGLQWVNVLQQGSAALKAQGQAVNSNLILTDKQIRETEKYRLAIDAAKDTIEGWKIAAVIGYMDAADAQDHAKESLEAYGHTGMEISGILQRNSGRVRELSQEWDRAAAYGEAWGKILKDNTVIAEEDAEAVKRMSEKNEKFISTLDSVGTALETYNSGIREADQALKAGEITVKEHDAKIKELSATYKSASADIVLSILQMKYATDGWTNSELNAYLEAGKSLGKFTDEQIKQTKTVITQADLLKNKMDNLGDNIYHTGKRAVDTSEEFGVLGRGASALGELVGKDAVPPVGALKSALNGMPASGTAWNYFFNISTSGSVPRMPTRGTYSGAGAGQLNNAGVDQEFGAGISHLWGGGKLGGGMAVVGDGPGGSWGPYTEVVLPGGQVLDAATSKKLKDAGMLDGAYSFAGGSAGGMVHAPTGGRTGGSTAHSTARRRGSGFGGRVGGASFSGGGGSLSGGGGGDGSSVDIANQTAAFIAPSLQAATTSSTVANNIAHLTGAQQTAKLDEAVNLLGMILNKLPSATQTAKATSLEASKNS